MPRRGDHQREFPPVEREAAVERIGLRVVSAPDRTGTMRAIVLDPSVFRCAVLAGELADEWVDYVDITNVTGSSAGLGRRAIRDFCTHVDSKLGEHAPGAGLAKQHPDVARVLAEWERTLPSRFRAGSTTPSTLAATVRALISRRAHHEQRPVAPGLRRLVDGEVGVPWGSTQEVDEFSRTDKHALVRAAWEWVNRLDPACRRMGGGRPGQTPGRTRLDGSRRPVVGSGPRAGQPTRNPRQPPYRAPVAARATGMHRTLRAADRRGAGKRDADAVAGAAALSQSPRSARLPDPAGCGDRARTRRGHHADHRRCRVLAFGGPVDPDQTTSTAGPAPQLRRRAGRPRVQRAGRLHRPAPPGSRCDHPAPDPGH